MGLSQQEFVTKIHMLNDEIKKVFLIKNIIQIKKIEQKNTSSK